MSNIYVLCPWKYRNIYTIIYTLCSLRHTLNPVLVLPVRVLFLELKKSNTCAYLDNVKVFYFLIFKLRSANWYFVISVLVKLNRQSDTSCMREGTVNQSFKINAIENNCQKRILLHPLTRVGLVHHWFVPQWCCQNAPFVMGNKTLCCGCVLTAAISQSLVPKWWISCN